MTSLLSSSSSDPHSPSSGKALDKSKVDYSVYLVTGRELLPEGVDFFQSLESSLKGGVTIVQLREKSIDNGEFRKIAVKCLEICDKYNVPLLINDNLSLCLSLPLRVGLHIGQTDIALPLARSLLGSSRLLGISCNTPSDAKTAREGGADYAGVGPVYGTLSKKGITEDKILGPRGVGPIVSALSDFTTQKRLPCVLIGGINQKTCLRSLFASVSKDNFADGVAVISAIQASLTPESAARELSDLVKTYKKGLNSIFSSRGSSSDFGVESAFGGTQHSSSKDISQLLKLSSEILKTHRDPPKGLSPPVIQTLTSHVSANFSANICLALSASPIMSQQFEEAEDLGKVTGGVVLNIGTIGPEARKGMKAVGMESNRGRKPVVLDPVGVGASAFRKEAVDEILNHTQITLIKGNAAELSSIYGGDSQVTSRGVDSGSGTLKDAPGLVRALAQRERSLVLLTGKVDLLSDGVRTVACENGHEMLGRVTGTGCGLGVTVATGLAAARNRWVVKNGEGGSDRIGSLGMVMIDADPQELFAGALMGLLSLTIASELAAARPEVKGPGTFIPALLDELAAISPETLLQRAKVQFI